MDIPNNIEDTLDEIQVKNDRLAGLCQCLDDRLSPILDALDDKNDLSELNNNQRAIALYELARDRRSIVALLESIDELNQYNTKFLSLTKNATWLLKDGD